MTQSDNDKIVKVVELRAPLARVWKAVTDHREFGHWFRVDLDQPFQPGGISTGKMTYPGHEGVPWVVYVERMRLGLAFPMCALDKATGLRRSWNASRGRGVSLWVLGLLVGLPIVIPHIVLSQFAFNTLEASNETAQILASLTSSVFDTLYYVLGAISLSLAYRQLGLDKQV